MIYPRRPWTFARWLAKFKNGPSAVHSTPAAKRRLSLESLEDRTLLTANELLGSQRLAFINGLDSYLQKVQDEVQANFGLLTKLPVIGDQLADKINVTSSFRSPLKTELLTGLTSDPANDHVSEVKTAIFTLLGPAGQNLLDDSDDLGADITIDDIQDTTEDGDPAAAANKDKFEKAEFAFKLKGVYDSAAASDTFNFTPGTEALSFASLSGTAAIQAEVNWTLKVKIGVRNFLGAPASEFQKGFYADTTAEDDLTFAAAITTPGFSVSAQFFNFTVSITQEDVYIDSRPAADRADRLQAKQDAGRDSVNIAQLQVRLDVQGPQDALPSFEPDPNSSFGADLPIELWTATFETQSVTNETQTNPGGGTSLTYSLTKSPVLPGTVTGTIKVGGTDIQTFTQNADGSFNLTDIGTPDPKVTALAIDAATGVLTATWSADPGANSLVVSYDAPGTAAPYTYDTLVSVSYLDGKAELNLRLITSAFGNSDVLPKFGFTINAGVGFNSFQLSTNGGLSDIPGVEEPYLEFNDVTIYLGTFLTKIVKPFAEPYRLLFGNQVDFLVGHGDKFPTKGLLNHPIPVYYDLTGSTTTLIDLAKSSGNPYLVAAALILQAVDGLNVMMIQAVADPSIDTLELNVGGVALDQLLSLKGLSEADQAETGATATAEPTPEEDNENAIVDDASASPVAKDFMKKFYSPPANEPTGFSMPFLKDPMQIIHLLAGEWDQVEFLRYDLGTDFDIDLTISPFSVASAVTNMIDQLGLPGVVSRAISGALNTILSTINFGLTVDMHFKASVSAGYDGHGIATYLQTGEPTDLAEGIFVSADGATTGVDFSGSISGYAELDVSLLKVWVRAGVNANAYFFLKDVTGSTDNKLRPSEFAAYLFSDPLCLCTAGGSVSFSLDAGLTVDLPRWINWLGIDDFSASVNLSAGVIGDFSKPCSAPPGLASKTSADGTYQLNVGLFAAVRGVADGPENIRVRSTGGTAGNETLEITVNGLTATITGVKKLIIKAGIGNDIVDLDGMLSEVSVDGGADNDTLTVRSSSPVYVNGGAGNDTITTGSAADRVIGGAGDDVMDGGGGRDYLDGQDGNDSVLGGDGDDQFNTGLGNDTLDGGAGTNMVLVSADANMDLANSLLTLTTGATALLANITQASLLGGAAGNTFTLSGFTGLAFIDGDSGTDTLVAVKDANFILQRSRNDDPDSTSDDNDMSVTASDGADFTLTSIESVRLTGGTSANTFTVYGTWSLATTLDGADGTDTYLVDYDLIDSRVVTINDTGTTGNDVATLDGSGTADNVFIVNGTQIGRNLEAFDYTGVDILTINGGSGTDVLYAETTSIQIIFNAGAGDDTVYAGRLDTRILDDVDALITFHGGDGTDVLNVDDTGDTVNNVGQMTSSLILGLGMDAGIIYDGFEAVNVNLGSGGDRFSVLSLATGAPTTVNAGSGNDLVNAGSLILGSGGTVNDFAALLTVRGGLGTDTLNVDDTGDTADNTGQLTTTFLSGLGTAGIDYAGLELFNAALGSGNDRFLVLSTLTTVSSLVNVGRGNDVLNLGSSLLGSGGIVNNILGRVTVRGDAGFDLLNVDDTGDGTNNLGTLTSTSLIGIGMTSGLFYGGVEDFTIALGSGGDRLTVLSTARTTATLVNAGAGNDTFSLGSVLLGTGGRLDGVAGPLTLRGDLGFDRADVDDSGATVQRVGQLTSTLLTGLGMAGSVTYGGLETFNLSLGVGDDALTVLSTARTVSTLVNTGAGNDAVTVGGAALGSGGRISSIDGTLTIRGGTGMNALNLDNTGQAANTTGQLTSSVLTGLGMTGRVYYGSFGAVNLALGAGHDQLRVLSTLAGATTVIDGGFGNDVVTVGSATGVNGRLANLRGNLLVRGGAGVNRLDLDNSGDNTNGTWELTDTTLSGPGMVGRIQYGGTDVLNLTLGNGHDTLTVRGTAATTTTTVNLGGGNDVVTLGSSQLGLGGRVNTLAGALTLRGGDGVDRLDVDDSGQHGDTVGQLTAAALTGLGMGAAVNYGGFDALSIALGTGHDRFTILGTAAGTPTTIHGGAGNDLFGVGGSVPGMGGVVDRLAALLTVRGGDGVNTLNLDNSGGSATTAGQLTSTTLTGLGMAAGVIYGGIHNLNLSLASSADLFTILSQAQGSTLRVGYNRGQP